MIRLSNEQGQQLLNYLTAIDVSGVPETVGVIVGQVREQLEHGNHAEDLVETVARIISANNIKATIGGTLASSLRQAILSPRELATVKATMNTYQACARCQRVLANGEIASLQDQAPYCTSCSAPSLHKCPKCKSKLALPTGVWRVIAKAVKECHGCAAGATATIEEPPADDHNERWAASPGIPVGAPRRQMIIQEATAGRPMRSLLSDSELFTTTAAEWRSFTMPTVAVPTARVNAVRRSLTDDLDRLADVQESDPDETE